MRYFLLFVVFTFSILSVFSQNYEKQWSEVYALELDGKFKSASEEVSKIYEIAKKDANQEQIIKSLLYQSKFILTLEEDGQSKILKKLQEEISQAVEPNKSILYYIYAHSLNEYLSKNSWEIRNRGYNNNSSENYLEWSLSDFNSEIKGSYQNSIENKTLLKNTFISDYKELIKYGHFGKVTDRTLYDFLVFEYIEYLSKEYYREKTPNSLSDNLLEEPEIFTKTDFSSLRINELITLFQELESDYLSEKKQADLERVWLQRLKKLNSKSYFGNEMMLASFRKFTEESKTQYYKYEAILEQAKLYSYSANKQEYPDYNQKAISLLDSLLVARKFSDAFIDGENLRKEIQHKLLEFEIVKNLYENENSRIHINHKNIDTVFANVYRVNYDIDITKYGYLKTEKDTIINKIIANQSPVKSFEIVLNNKKDYFQYSTEALLPKFEKGKYLLVLTDKIKTNDSLDLNELGCVIFGVTNISVKYFHQKNSTNFLVLDRKTGKPLKNAKVEVDEYRGYTNQDGEVSIKTRNKKEDSNKMRKILVTYQDDTYSEFYYDSYNRYYQEEAEENWEASAEIYTDRAIYRPGQNLYYKVIVYQDKNGKRSVVPNVYVELSIQDEMGEVLEEKRIKTNEFGSYSGEFLIPNNIITGDLYIDVDEDFDYELDKKYNKIKDEHPFWDNIDYFSGNHIAVKVEEYKRPTFEVIFDSEIKDYVVNDTVVVTGKAKSFSGAILSNAKVSYEVNRITNYSKPLYNSYISDGEKITFEETTTDNNGNFVIKFKAIPNKSAAKEYLPIFKYLISTSVTDTQGETRSGETNVNIGYHNLNLSVNVAEQIISENPFEAIINSTNLNNTFFEADIVAKIYKTNSENKKFKNRTFKKPDYQSISKEDFEKLFPYESNNASDDDVNKDELIFEKSFNTGQLKNLIIDNIRDWKAGEYKIIISSVDKNTNQEILDERIFKVKNPKELSTDKLFEFHNTNNDYKKSKKIKYQLLSSLKQPLSILVLAYNKGKVVYKKRHELTENTLLEIPYNSDWKDAINMHFSFDWENSNYSYNDKISIETIENVLTTEVVKMNNILEPGSGQTWSFIIKDKNGKGATTEVLASMYDMSLDEFNKTTWRSPRSYRDNYYNYDYYYDNYFGNYFNIAQQRIGFNLIPKHRTRNTNRDTFNYFGYDINNSKNASKIYLDYLSKQVSKPSFSDNAKVIKGVVMSSEDGLPLPGATVINRTKNYGTSTNLDGEFEIQGDLDDVIEISFISMNSKEIIINKENILIIHLDNDESSVQELYVVGYASSTKEAFTSTSTKTTLSNLSEALRGEVAGVNILSGSGGPGSSDIIQIRGISSLANSLSPLYIIDGVPLDEDQIKNLNASDLLNFTVLKGAEATTIYGSKGVNGVVLITTTKSIDELKQVQTRKNLKETAFFYPNITTDKKGNLSFNFTSPEALSSWKFRMLSHTKNAVFGYYESTIITQKDLMIQPNMPRFVRETDTIIIKAKVSNLSNQAQNGIAMLQLTNITTQENINIKNDVVTFNTSPKSSETLSWQVIIPRGTQGLEYKITAKAGNFTDGEQSVIPVLPNRILVNESIPIWMREKSKKDFVFENLKNNKSETLEHNSFTLEYTSNPTWIAIGSLPYLMQYEHECSEQIFSKYYANVIASHIVEENPKIKDVFTKWSNNPTSKLQQNQELKNILLTETPWVLEAQSEEEQKKNLATLFELQKLKTSSDEIFKKLEELQKNSGGFGWFEGSPENTYITTHIVTGFGHLKKMSVDTVYTQKFDKIIDKAISFLDKNFIDQHNNSAKNQIVSRAYNQLNYLYARSFYPEITTPDSLKSSIKHKIKDFKQDWLHLSLNEKGMLALILHRNSDTATAIKILEHLKESAVINTDFGMYWLENVNSPYWHKASIETQALLIEAFSEISPNDTAIEQLKVWLIKQKQTKHWSTTKSTTLAVNALLLGKKDFVSLKEKTTFSIGKENFKSDNVAQEESETGYIKLSWKGDKISNDFAEITIENNSESVGYGGLYWSYFEELENIKSSTSELMKIEKELYLKKNSAQGKEFVKITKDTKLKLGDLVTVRLVLKVSENMDFVHLKDMRASGFEPVEVLSKYEYKGGLSYYQSTKDVATHFFFDSIQKGTHVLEYDVLVNNLGNFSNGITTLQSMYAPEYNSHTTSARVAAEE